MSIERGMKNLILAVVPALILSSCGGGGGGGVPALPSTPPAVVTDAPSSITTDNAVLNGTVDPNGTATNYWFEYGTSPTLSNPSYSDNLSAGAGTGSVAVQAVPALTPYQTYYFRLAAENAYGITRGAIQSFPTGKYFVALGDSITFGQGDDIPSDGFGFDPILDNLLTTEWGYPVTIANEGMGGDSSADGAAAIATVLASHPESEYFLILYGTNDADISRPPVPSGLGLHPGDAGYANSYKDYMQRIVSAVVGAGKTPYLAKVPYTTNQAAPDGYSITAIQNYNLVIAELKTENGIAVEPPDFYAHFEANPGELADGLHPDGMGYQSMANLWFWALIP